MPKRVLSASDRILVLQLFAEYETGSQIKAKLEEERGVNVSVQNLYQTRDRYIEDVQKLRTEFLTDLSKIPVTQKAYRLKCRQRMVERLIRDDDPEHFTTLNRILDSVKNEIEAAKFDVDIRDTTPSIKKLAEAYEDMTEDRLIALLEYKIKDDKVQNAKKK